jgi:hypothetical protein
MGEKKDTKIVKASISQVNGTETVHRAWKEVSCTEVGA